MGPPSSRVVNEKTVRRPEFYGDTGGQGWYAEAQHPRRVRLESRRTSKDLIWVYCDRVVLSPIPSPVDVAGVKSHFKALVKIVSAQSISLAGNHNNQAVVLDCEDSCGADEIIKTVTKWHEAGQVLYRARKYTLSQYEARANVLLVKETESTVPSPSTIQVPSSTPMKKSTRPIPRGPAAMMKSQAPPLSPSSKCDTPSSNSRRRSRGTSITSNNRLYQNQPLHPCLPAKPTWAINYRSRESSPYSSRKSPSLTPSPRRRRRSRDYSSDRGRPGGFNRRDVESVGQRSAIRGYTRGRSMERYRRASIDRSRKSSSSRGRSRESSRGRSRESSRGRSGGRSRETYQRERSGEEYRRERSRNTNKRERSKRSSSAESSEAPEGRSKETLKRMAMDRKVETSLGSPACGLLRKDDSDEIVLGEGMAGKEVVPEIEDGEIQNQNRHHTPADEGELAEVFGGPVNGGMSGKFGVRASKPIAMTPIIKIEPISALHLLESSVDGQGIRMCTAMSPNDPFEQDGGKAREDDIVLCGNEAKVDVKLPTPSWEMGLTLVDKTPGALDALSDSVTPPSPSTINPNTKDSQMPEDEETCTPGDVPRTSLTERLSKFASWLHPQTPTMNLQQPYPAFIALEPSSLHFSETREQLHHVEESGGVVLGIEDLSEEERRMLGFEEVRIWNWNVGEGTKGIWRANGKCVALPAV